MQPITRATRAILLARVSDVRQDTEDAQLSNIKHFAQRFNFETIEEYRIKESSTKGDRRKFQEIISEIKASKVPVALIVDTVDRLQRTFREFVLFDDLLKQGKVELYFYRENLVLKSDANSSDMMRWQMGVMFANNYVLQLGDNVKRKFKQMREEGKRTGPAEDGYMPVYEVDRAGKRHRIDIVPDPEKAPLIAEAFRLFASGMYSIKTLTLEMQRRGLTGRTGNLICTSKLHFILSNPFYYGLMRSKGETMPHIYEPIITEELFMQVQKILKGRRKNPTKFVSYDYIFRGLIHCANCGCLYSPERKRGYLIYYSCTNAKHNCKRDYMREEKLLEPVLEILSKLELPKEKVAELVKALRKSTESKGLYQKEERNRLTKIINNEQIVIDGAAVKFARSEIEKEVYDRLLTASREKQRHAEAEIAKHSDLDEDYFINAERVINIASRAREIFESSEVDEKRAFLSFLLQNPTADGEKLEFTLRSPFQELLSVADHPNELRD